MRLRKLFLAVLVSGVTLVAGISLLWYVVVEREGEDEIAPLHPVQFAVDTHPRVIELHSLLRPDYFNAGHTRMVPGMSAEDLPYLYELLKNDTVRDTHHNALYVIACLGRGNERAARELKKFIDRPVNNIDYYDMLDKCFALEYMGLISGDFAEETLRLALISDGAKLLSKPWYHNEFGFDDATTQIRASAARGLVYTGDSQNIKIVENAYDEAVRTVKSKLEWLKDRGLWEALPQIRFYEDTAYALALRDSIGVEGLDSFFPAIHGITWTSRATPYLKKYLVLDALKDEASRAAGL